jgi:hypothetical protein
LSAGPAGLPDVKDVPVDGFWSISVYNAKGYFEPNPQNAYTLNNITAKKSPVGSVAIQFGGCETGIANCLPVTPGWNYPESPFAVSFCLLLFPQASRRNCISVPRHRASLDRARFLPTAWRFKLAPSFA